MGERCSISCRIQCHCDADFTDAGPWEHWPMNSWLALPGCGDDDDDGVASIVCLRYRLTAIHARDIRSAPPWESLQNQPNCGQDYIACSHPAPCRFTTENPTRSRKRPSGRRAEIAGRSLLFHIGSLPHFWRRSPAAPARREAQRSTPHLSPVRAPNRHATGHNYPAHCKIFANAMSVLDVWACTTSKHVSCAMYLSAVILWSLARWLPVLAGAGLTPHLHLISCAAAVYKRLDVSLPVWKR